MSDPIFDKLLSTEQKKTEGAPSGPVFDALMGIEQSKGSQFLGQINQAVDINPDQYNTERKTAKLLDVPTAAVQALPEDTARDAKVKTLRDNTANAPVLRQQYTDADFAKLAHDDSEPLSAIEKLVEVAKYAVSAPGAARGGLLSDIGLAGRSIASGIPRLSSGMWGAVAAVPGVVGWTSAEQWALGQQKQADAMAKRWQGLDPKAGFVEQSVMSGFQSAGQNLALLPLGLARTTTEVGTNAILTLMGISTGGESYAKAREKGANPYVSLAYGLEDAAAEVVFEKYFGIGGFMKNVKAGSGAGKLFVYEVSKELPGEMATTLVQNFNEWMNLNPNKSISEFMAEQPEALVQTAIATLVGGSTQIGAVKSAEKVLGSFADAEAQMRAAEDQRAMLEQLSALTQQSKLKARDSETFQRFMDAATDGTPVQDVYIGASALMQSGIAEQLAQALPEVAEQLPTALASDGFVRIPTSQYAAVIAGSQLEQAVIDHVKVDPNGYTFAESKEYASSFNQEMQTQLEKAMLAHEGDVDFKAERDQVRDDFLGQLNQSKRFTEDVNNAYASMLSNFYAVTAAKLGMSPRELVDRYQLNVNGRQQASAQFDQAKADLLIQHNLSSENLLHAVKMGGIAVPSLAVTKKESPLTSFGEITLLGNGDMANPRGSGGKTKVFGADIYSPRYPQISYRIDKKATKSLNEALAPYRKEGDREIYGSDIRQVDDLTHHAAFKRYADEKLGANASWSKLKSFAEKTLSNAGATEHIFRGFDYNGNRRYSAHTLENVVKILKSELRGGEGFNYGVGNLRAKLTPEFKSIEQIRKNKNRLMSAEDFKKVKKEVDDQLVKLSEDLNLSLDQTLEVIEDAPKMGAIKAIERAFEDYSDGGSPTAEQVKDVAEYLTKLRNLPTAYFEAKILRNVELNEFSGAVVPDDVDPKVLELLNDRGITDIRTYKSGDENDRAVKIGEFDNLFFQSAESGPRGQIFFGKDITETPSVIALLKGADLSTFIHESGHFFLQVQADLAARIQAQIDAGATVTEGERSIVADMNKLLDWMGVKGDVDLTALETWQIMTTEEQRQYHEKFARGFEAYAFEGRAPTMELQSIFQKFSAWLKSVYTALKNLNVELTDEVRGVMDRMLATNEQIDAAEAARNMGPLFTVQNAQGIIDDWNAYHALANDATLAATDELQARSLKELQWASRARSRVLKDLQKQHNAIRSELMMESRREVMSQPIYRAWQFLTGKLSKEDRSAMRTEPERKSAPGSVDPSIDSLFVAIAKIGGLDRDQVESQWGWDKKERSPSPLFGKPLLRRQGGLSIDTVGEMLAEYGYLQKDENGKYDMSDFEVAFDSEYRGSPVYSIEHDYAGSQDQRPGEGLSMENLGAGRFDLTSLKMIGLDEAVIDRLKSLNMTAKDGIHPDIIADLIVDENGVPVFSSGNELAQRLAQATSPKVAIEKLTDQKMLERFGDLATPEAREQAADQAIHNELRAKMLHAEARALERAMEVNQSAGTNRLGRRQTFAVLPKAAQEFAQRLIAGLRVRDIRPSQYAAAEVKAAKAAERAFAKNDLEATAEQKRNQILNHYATREAYAAQDDIRSAVAYLRRFDKRSKSLDPDYYDQIVQILERFDLVPSTSLKTIDKRTSLANWLAAQEEQGIVPEIPPELSIEAFRKSYKDMTVEELRGLRDTIRQIEHLGRLKSKLLTAQDQREFNAIRDEMTDSIIENGRGRVADNRTPNTVLGEKLVKLKRFWASHIKAATWARIMDGGKDGGPVWEYLIRTANNAGNNEVVMREKATRDLSALVAPVLAEGKMGGKGEFFPSIGRTLNKEARLAIALNIGNQSNEQRLLGGENWTVEQIKPVLDTLTTADWTFVQAVWDYFESYRPEIGAKERRVYGSEPKWIEARPLLVQTRDGDTINLRGGYYPVKYDPRSSELAESHMEAEDAKRMMQGAYTSATTRRSFTKERVDAVVGRPLLYSLDGLYNGVNEVIHDLTWHEWLIDANRIIKNPKIAEAMRDTYGAEVHQQFKNWLKDVAEGERGAQKAGEDALAWVRQGVSVAGLGINVMSALLQPFGITQSMVRIGSKYVGRGIAKTIADPFGVSAEINEMSDFMRTRGLTRMRELAELRNQVKGQTKTRANIDAAAYALMLRAQQLVDIPTWWGAYEKATAEGNDQDRAVALADQAVIDAQGSGTVKDLSAIERGGPALKLFTTFYSFMNTALNMGVAQTMTSTSKAKLAADMLLIYVVPVVLIELMKSAFTPGDSGDWEDPEKIAMKLIKSEVSYIAGLFFGVRELSGIVEAFQGKPSGEYSGPAGTRIISDSLKLAKQIGQGDMDDGLRKSVINVAGELFRLPAAQINRSITGAKALAEGETQNPLAVVFGYEKRH